jgi:hypothetical protein
MFDIYTTKPQVLDDPDAEALARELEQNGLSKLADRIRYGFRNDTLVEVDPTEHGFLIEALTGTLQAGTAGSEQLAALAAHLQARVAGGGERLPPMEQVGESIRASFATKRTAQHVDLCFEDVRLGFDPHEAHVLSRLLERERDLAARRLARRISAASLTGESVQLNMHEFRALCALARDSDELTDLRTQLTRHLRLPPLH